MAPPPYCLAWQLPDHLNGRHVAPESGGHGFDWPQEHIVFYYHWLVTSRGKGRSDLKQRPDAGRTSSITIAGASPLQRYGQERCMEHRATRQRDRTTSATAAVLRHGQGFCRAVEGHGCERAARQRGWTATRARVQWPSLVAVFCTAVEELLGFVKHHSDHECVNLGHLDRGQSNGCERWQRAGSRSAGACSFPALSPHTSSFV